MRSDIVGDEPLWYIFNHVVIPGRRDQEDVGWLVRAKLTNKNGTKMMVDGTVAIVIFYDKASRVLKVEFLDGIVGRVVITITINYSDFTIQTIDPGEFTAAVSAVFVGDKPTLEVKFAEFTSISPFYIHFVAVANDVIVESATKMVVTLWSSSNS